MALSDITFARSNLVVARDDFLRSNSEQRRVAHTVYV